MGVFQGQSKQLDRSFCGASLGQEPATALFELLVAESYRCAKL